MLTGNSLIPVRTFGILKAMRTGFFLYEG